MDDRPVDEINGSLDIQSFIVRIWFEEPAGESRTRSWHGQVTDVHSGEQHSIKDLNEIVAFIQAHMNR